MCWGISKEVEDSAKYYLQQMLKQPNKKKYRFTYYSSKGDFDFNIIIGKFKNPNQYGEFIYYHDDDSENKTSGYYIKITKISDLNTLIHELKHFDRHLRKGPNTDMLSLGVMRMSDMKVSELIHKIFYMFNVDEFEARLHEYYLKIDEHLSENLIKNPTSKDVVSMINHYLENVDDDTFKLWKIDFNIDIMKNSTKKELINIFNEILENKPLLPSSINFNDIKGTYKSLIKFIKSKIGMVAAPDNFDNLVKKTNLEINRNKEKFNKKFNRLYSIMIDKYVYL
jgi:hypothetical protein